MPNPPEPTAPSGEEQTDDVTLLRIVAGSWEIDYPGTTPPDRLRALASRLSALHTELERTRAALTEYGKHKRGCWGLVNPGDASACNCGFIAALGSPDATTRRTDSA